MEMEKGQEKRSKQKEQQLPYHMLYSQCIIWTTEKGLRKIVEVLDCIKIHNQRSVETLPNTHLPNHAGHQFMQLLVLGRLNTS